MLESARTTVGAAVRVAAAYAAFCALGAWAVGVAPVSLFRWLLRCVASVAVDDRRPSGSTTGAPTSTRLVVSNHCSFFDWLILTDVLECPSFVMSGKHFHTLVVRWIARRLHYVLVDRRNERLVDTRGDPCGLLLDASDAPRHHVVFAESLMTDNMHLERFKRGAFVLGLPVAPVVLLYDRTDVDPQWHRPRELLLEYATRVLRPGRLRVRVLRLPDVAPLEDERAEEFAERVRRCMAHASGLTCRDPSATGPRPGRVYDAEHTDLDRLQRTIHRVSPERIVLQTAIASLGTFMLAGAQPRPRPGGMPLALLLACIALLFGRELVEGACSSRPDARPLSATSTVHHVVVLYLTARSAAGDDWCACSAPLMALLEWTTVVRDLHRCVDAVWTRTLMHVVWVVVRIGVFGALSSDVWHGECRRAGVVVHDPPAPSAVASLAVLAVLTVLWTALGDRVGGRASSSSSRPVARALRVAARMTLLLLRALGNHRLLRERVAKRDA
jgi:1-acyl-sn-glycerol-3-phosphate acyltransferase